MSILKFAKNASKKAASWAWKNSGAQNIDALEGSRKLAASTFSRKGKGGGTAPSLEASGDPEKLSIESNRRAHQQAMGDQEKGGGSGTVVSPVSPQMEKDIHEMREMMEKGSGMGGAMGGLGGLLGSLTGMLQKIPGWGKVAAWGAGAAAAGKGLLGKGGSMLSGALNVVKNGKVGTTVAEGLGKAGGFVKGLLPKGLAAAGEGVGKVAGTATSFLPAIKSSIGGVVEKGGQLISSLGTKGAGLAASAGSTILGAAKSAGGAAGGLIDAVKSKGAGVLEAGKSLAGKAMGMLPGVAKLGGATAAKTAVKKVPVLGLLAGVGFGIKRALDGDFVGAGMEVASGLASTIPGPGTAASVGIDAALIGRDVYKGGSEGEAEAIKAAVEPNAAAVSAATVPAGAAVAAVPPSANAVLAAHKTSTSDVPSGLANLQAFVAMAMDEKQGIFVRPARNELQDNVARPGLQNASFTPGTQGATQAPLPVARDAGSAGAVAATPRPSAMSAMQVTPEGVVRRMPTEAGRGTLTPTPPGADMGRVPKFTREMPTSAMAGSDLGNLISRGEGDYNSYNSGTKGVAGGKVGHSGKKDLASMTLNEIIESSEKRGGNDKDRVFAAGRYQIITPTLKGAMKKMDLKGDEKFTPELQDKIFQEALLPKSAKDFISGKSTDMEKAQLDLAKEWRSFADPRTGKTYADAGASANKASITASESAKALQATRDQYAKTQGSEFALQSPQNKTSETLAAEVKKDVETKASPIIVPVPTPQPQQAQAAPSSGGPAGIGGHMGTRNDDSSIRRITDAKMGYGMV